MAFIALGVLGFIGFLLFDVFSMKDKFVLKYFFVSVGIGLIGFSTFKLMQFPDDLLFSSPARYISLVLAVLFFALLIYSVFIEVGMNTYETVAKPELVTNGTYSLVRHPGVIWLFLVYFFIAIYFQNSYLFVTAFIWTFVNTVYIVIQERYILIHLFEEYEHYRRTTPMVIPNSSSLRKFITIQNWRKE